METAINIKDFIEEVKKVDEEFAECVDSGKNIKNLIDEYLLSSWVDYFEWQTNKSFPFKRVDLISEKGNGKDEETTTAIFERKSDGMCFSLWMHDAGFIGPSTLTLCDKMEAVYKTVETIKKTTWK